MNADQFTDEPAGSFRRANSYTLAATVEEPVLAKIGSMVAYTGDVSFTGKLSAGGITGLVKETVTNEETPVMKVAGDGEVYLADDGRKVQVLELDETESITVSGDDVLAFESSVSYDVGAITSLAGTLAGGFTTVSLAGPGAVAVTTDGDPLVFDPPVTTDPAATVAWSGTSPSVSVNKKLTDMIGAESDERYQMAFGGDEGFVVVQPQEKPRSETDSGTDSGDPEA